MRRFVPLFLLLLSMHFAYGQVTYYVNGATGDDGRTPEVAQDVATPWQTIQHAVAEADYTQSVTIVVVPFETEGQAGVYEENTITIENPVAIQTLDDQGGISIRNTSDVLFEINVPEGDVRIEGFNLEESTQSEHAEAIRLLAVNTLTVARDTIQGFSTAISLVNPVDKIFVSENFIHNNGNGISISSDIVSLPPEVLTIFSNSFEGNGVAINNPTENLIIADYNWWGTRDRDGVLAAVTSGSANVDYSPWLNDNDDGGDFGFQNDFSSFSVDASSPRQEVAENELQEAFNNDQVNAGDSLFLFGDPLTAPVYTSLVANKAVTLVAESATIDNLNVNLPDDADANNDTLRVIGQLTITNSLALSSGTIKTENSSQVILGENVGNVNEDRGRMIGQFTIVPRTIASEQTLTILGLSISQGSDMGLVQVTRINGKGSAITSEETGNESIDVRWIIDAEVDLLSEGRNIIFSWRPEDDNGKVFDIQDNPAVVWRLGEEGATWQEIASERAVSPGGGLRSIEVQDVRQFSTWTVSDINSPLPVILTNFTARLDESSVRLHWATASEINSDYFGIERSTDGFTYQPLARTKAAGDSQTEQHYRYIDEGVANRLAGTVYYRLHMVDFDGSSEYSPIVAVSLEGDLPLLVYANSQDGTFTLFASLPEEAYTVQVSDLLGNILFETSLATPPDRREYALAVPALSQSVYILRCLGAKDVYVRKFRVE